MLVPARTLEVEISRPIQGVGPGSTDDGSRYLSAVVLVRLHGQPLGTLELDLTAGPIEAGQIAEQIWGLFEPAILNHLHDDGIRQAGRLTEAGIGVEDTPGCLRLDDTALPFASVVISTRERPGSLAACLDSILQADYPHFEVLV